MPTTTATRIDSAATRIDSALYVNIVRTLLVISTLGFSGGVGLALGAIPFCIGLSRTGHATGFRLSEYIQWITSLAYVGDSAVLAHWIYGATAMCSITVALLAGLLITATYFRDFLDTGLYSYGLQTKVLHLSANSRDSAKGDERAWLDCEKKIRGSAYSRALGRHDIVGEQAVPILAAITNDRDMTGNYALVIAFYSPIPEQLGRLLHLRRPPWFIPLATARLCTNHDKMIRSVEGVDGFRRLRGRSFRPASAETIIQDSEGLGRAFMVDRMCIKTLEKYCRNGNVPRVTNAVLARLYKAILRHSGSSRVIALAEQRPGSEFLLNRYLRIGLSIVGMTGHKHQHDLPTIQYWVLTGSRDKLQTEAKQTADVLGYVFGRPIGIIRLLRGALVKWFGL